MGAEHKFQAQGVNCYMKSTLGLIMTMVSSAPRVRHLYWCTVYLVFVSVNQWLVRRASVVGCCVINPHCLKDHQRGSLKNGCRNAEMQCRLQTLLYKHIPLFSLFHSKQLLLSFLHQVLTCVSEVSFGNFLYEIHAILSSNEIVFDF